MLLWRSYQVKKKHMDMKNGDMDNERILFHGTDADSVPHINQHGFNRSYAGKNGKEPSNLTDQNEVNGSSHVDYSHPSSVAVDGSHVVIVRMQLILTHPK